MATGSDYSEEDFNDSYDEYADDESADDEDPLDKAQGDETSADDGSADHETSADDADPLDRTQDESSYDNDEEESENESTSDPQADKCYKKPTTFDETTSGPTKTLRSDAKASDFFELFFSDKVIANIVEKTNQYARHNPPPSGYGQWKDVNPETVKSFLGAVIAMTWRKYTSAEDYWSSHALLGCEVITNSWPIKKFKLFLRCLHLNDDKTIKPRGNPPYDKLHEVRPLLEQIKKLCLSNFNPYRDNAIDEAMVGFKGRSTLKQYCPMKPTKQGFKIWCRADCKTGYMCDFSVYTGKDGDKTVKDLGAKVVKELAEPLKHKGHRLVFDNYFSSISLLEDLLKDEIGCVATTRSDRRGFPPDLKDLSLKMGKSKSMSIKNVQIIVWKDKKNVHFLDSVFDSTSTTHVPRKQKDGKKKNIPCPEAVKFYNDNMGAVDRHNQKRKSCSCSRKSKEWWQKLFYFLVDISLVNAHILETESKKSKDEKRTLKEFCMEIAMEYLSLDSSRERRTKRQSSLPPASPQATGLHKSSEQKKASPLQHSIHKK